MKKAIVILTILLASTNCFTQEMSEDGKSALIKYYEGLHLRAYYCPANVLTIGWGHTGKDVKQGMVISKEQAELLLNKDLRKFVMYSYNRIERGLLWNELDALTSFSFNLGSFNNAIKKQVELRNTNLVKLEIMKYTHARVKGKMTELRGLVLRRGKEANWYAKSITN